VAGYGGIGATALPRSAALTGIDLEVVRGATVGVIGESGSGKSTLARVIAGLVPAARGTLSFDGAVLPATLERRTREQFRRIQIVFQDADTALNPAHTIGRILGRPLELYHGVRGDLARHASPGCSTWCTCRQTLRSVTRPSCRAARSSVSTSHELLPSPT
jgi:peptide/nickel transport system ATP-binding protein